MTFDTSRFSTLRIMKGSNRVNMQHFQYTEQGQLSQMTFNPLPAVAIGGPPHSGKSVLTYSLTQALRAQGCEHYVIRAYPPDGEGDWFLASEPAQVRHLRLKGARSEAWLAPLKRDVAARHLPLIVDMGGLPTPDQETVLETCTHGVLLTPDADSQREWRARFARHGLVLLADVHSERTGPQSLETTAPVLRGTLSGLERGQPVQGAVFEALVQKIAALFAAATPGLRRYHLAHAPVELTVDLVQLAQHLQQDPRAWDPAALPAVLDYLPTATPLGLYGRGPNWLYAAVAAATRPADFYLFDARLGWVAAPRLNLGPPRQGQALQVRVQEMAGVARVDLHLVDAYLDITEISEIQVPPLSAEGMIFNGKLPFWLLTALVRSYTASWLGVFQPQAGGIVVVASEEPGRLLGAILKIGAIRVCQF